MTGESADHEDGQAKTRGARKSRHQQQNVPEYLQAANRDAKPGRPKTANSCTIFSTPLTMANPAPR